MIHLGKGTGSGLTQSTGVGVGVLLSNLAGHDNTGVGFMSLSSNTSGYNNAAVGTNSLLNSTSGHNNVALGFTSLSANTIGNYNTAVGSNSLSANLTGVNNTAIGYNTLHVESTSQNNVAVGSNSMPVLHSNSNTAVGASSLFTIGAGGNSNTALGYSTLYSITVGSNNLATGVLSMKNWTNGSGNTANGSNALFSAGTGNENTTVGFWSLNKLTSGNYNTALGAYSLEKITTGNSNVALGHGAMNGQLDGSNNVAIGVSANVPVLTSSTGAVPNNQLSIQNVIHGKDMDYYLNAKTSIGILNGPNQIVGGLANGGWAKLHIGGFSGYTIPSLQLDYVPTYTGELPVTNPSTTGKYLFIDAAGVVCQAAVPAAGPGTVNNDAWLINGNVSLTDANFIGSGSAEPIVPFNIRIAGHLAGRIDETGANLYYGFDAGIHNPQGDNTAIGNHALEGIAGHEEDPATDNTAVGAEALVKNYGNSNSAVGSGALRKNESGSANVALGHYAAVFNVSGEGNVAVGTSSLWANITGNNNTVIGTIANTATDGLTNATAIGYSAIVDNSNTIQLGAHDNFNDVEQVTVGTAFNTDLVRTRLSTPRVQVVDGAQTNYVLTCLNTNGDAVWAPACCIRPGEYDEKINEQNRVIDGLVKQNAELKKEMDELKALITANQKTNIEGTVKLTQLNVDAQLFQNAPNPFNRSTVIKYSIPSDAKKAILTITSVSGVKIKEFDLRNKANQIEITGGQFSAGVYVYSLFVDDVFIDAKQMILTK